VGTSVDQKHLGACRNILCSLPFESLCSNRIKPCHDQVDARVSIGTPDGGTHPEHCGKHHCQSGISVIRPLHSCSPDCLGDQSGNCHPRSFSKSGGVL